MKHTIKVTTLLVALFFVAQLVGIYVAHVYQPIVTPLYNETAGTSENVTNYNLPYGFEPPQGIKPTSALTQIMISLAIAIALILLLIRFRAESVIRIWFFVVVIIGIALALNAFIFSVQYAPYIALICALPLAYLKIFKRNIITHNLTELLIYPGIAAVFIPLLSIWTGVILLLLISAYDIYAVWHTGFMQKMAKYQMEQVRVFSGFFIPYMGSKERKLIANATSKGVKQKKVSVQVAILGGGDVVFPIILAGIALSTLGLYAALMIAIGATSALSYLFYISEKGRFYPAMPFISAGCLIALGLAHII